MINTKIKSLQATLFSLALTLGLSSASASIIINPNTPISNVAANAGSSLSYLVSGTQNGGGSSLTYDASSTTLATGTDVSIALATTETLDGVANSYVTPANNPDYFTSGTAPILTFTLGDVYDDIDSIILWNYTHDNESNQTKDFSVSFYSDTDASIQVGDTYSATMLERPGAASSVAAEQFIFGEGIVYSGIQSFTVTLSSNHSGNRVGLSEVRLTQVPEPETFALLGGMCALGFVMLRRRAK
ncbi:PEP-CTERM sorting domain-containing protein [Coraliomargarita algicola]|uniref:PEP-CTERM sorting domain-containing protein n=1 Tax=Coraliomargarita algicola TaxID=3092156 RepID=A0ABZ0RGS9_9BACT|nr:PEP-CTERM sorting domain-containing protein [Coraliomargarita sp. J2-16]WPJ95385.1 PEP-CTERM sorting domain-containing protein [Coraliomargarita sp. J2-16]